MAPNGFRVSLDLSSVFQDVRRFCYIFVNLERHIVIRDLEVHVRNLFGIKNRIFLAIDKFLLPSDEPVQILKSNDYLRVLKICGKGICRMQTHSSALGMQPCDGEVYRMVSKPEGEQNEGNGYELRRSVVRRNMITGEEVIVARVNVPESAPFTEGARSRIYRQPCATDNVAQNSVPDVDGEPVDKRKKENDEELDFSDVEVVTVKIGPREQELSNDPETFESDINENTVIEDDDVSESNTIDLDSINMSLCNLNNLNQSSISKKERSPLYDATTLKSRLLELEKIGREPANADTKSKKKKHKKAHSTKVQNPSLFNVDSPFLSKSVTDQRGIKEYVTSTKNETEQTPTNYESDDMSLTSQNNFNQPTISKSKLLTLRKQTSEPAPLNSEARGNSLADTEEIKLRKRKRKRVHSKKSKRLNSLSLAETISLMSKTTVDPGNSSKKQELSPRASDHKHIRFPDFTLDEEKGNNLEASLESCHMAPMNICTPLTSSNIASAAKSSRLVNKSHKLVSNSEEPLDQSNMSLCSVKSFSAVNNSSVSPKPLFRAMSLPSSSYSEPDVPARLSGNLKFMWDIKYPTPMKPTNQSRETFDNLLSLRHTSAPCVFKRKQSKRESAQNDGEKNVSPADQPQETVSCKQEATVQPTPENSHTSADESNLPIFNGVPKKNDHFIFKTLILTEDCVPRLSADITGIVQEYFPSTSEVELKILSGSEQLQQSVKKFSIGDEEIEPCDIVLLNWNEMIEPKLIN